MSFAKAVLSGVLASEPEKRFTPNQHPVTNFTMLVENLGTPGRGGAGEPFPVKVTCWRNLAEAVSTRLHKDDYVMVEGKLMINAFQAQDGSQKKMFELEAASIDRLPGKPEAILAESGGANGGEGSYSASARTETPAYEAAYKPAAGQQPATGGHFSSEDLLTEDDIPF